jgi:hypothetical protein
MKKKLFFSGIISILLIFTFMAGCDNGTTTVEVTITPPAVTVTMTPPEVTHIVPVPDQNYNAVAKGLMDAEETYLAKPEEGIPVVKITGQIPIRGNTSLVVPDNVILLIDVGGRLTVEANALLFVRAKGKIIVKGELHFEKFAQGDDVRQAKIVGDIDADGGTVYDKTDEGVQLQYVSKITNGGILKYGGGTVAGGVHEKFFLGANPAFTGDGYIKLAFSDGWNKYNPVQVDTTIAGNTLLTQPIVAAVPGTNPLPSRLVGFEVYGNVNLTGEMILPDTIEDTSNPPQGLNPLYFTVKEGAVLTVGAGAALKSETNTQNLVSGIVVEDNAKVFIDGFMGFPKLPDPGVQVAPNPFNPSKNYGLVTVNSTGTLFLDHGVLDTVFNEVNFGELVAKGGSKIFWDRTLLPDYSVFLSTGSAALGLQTSAGTDVSFTKSLWKITGSGTNAAVIIKANPAWADAPGTPPFFFPLLANLEINRAEVTVKTTLTGSAAASGEKVTVTNGGKLIVEVPFGAAAGTGDHKIGGVTVTGEGSEFVSANKDVIFAAGYPLSLGPKTKGTFRSTVAVTAMKAGLNPAGVTANKALIAYEGAPNYGTDTVANGVTAVAVSGYDVSFDSDVNFQQSVGLTGGANLTFSAGTVTTGAFGWTLAGGSTVKVNNMVDAYATAGSAFTLSGGSIVTIAGKLEFSGAAAFKITLNDDDSKVDGSVSGGSKIVKSGTGDLTYETVSNAAFKKLFAPKTADTDSTVARVVPTSNSITWGAVNGTGDDAITVWGVPE